MERQASDVCIHAPELLTRREQIRDAFATGIMWALYAYLWLPLISLLAWILGFEFAYDVMIRAGGSVHLKTVLYWYGIAVSTIFVAFGVWSLSNRLRFGNRERRGHLDAVTDDSFMTFFGISAADLERLRTGRSLVLELDAVGAIREIADSVSASSRTPGWERRREESADDQ